MQQSCTVYICSTGRHQQLAAPLVVGLLTEIRSTAYEMDARQPGSHAMLFALDEVANIAPIPDLPAMVSEGGGQGIVTVACMQDLSQARQRWGGAADGFMSLFGTKVILRGIGDVETLRAISALAGEKEIESRSHNSPLSGRSANRAVAERLLLGPSRAWRPSESVTVSTTRVPNLPVDASARGADGLALVLDEANRTGWIGLTPWHSFEPWRSLATDRNIEGIRLPTTRSESLVRERLGPQLEGPGL